MTAFPSRPIFVISGFPESRENSAVQVRDASSAQRTANVSAVAETPTGPFRTLEISAGMIAARLSLRRTGIRRMVSLSISLLPQQRYPFVVMHGEKHHSAGSPH